MQQATKLLFVLLAISSVSAELLEAQILTSWAQIGNFTADNWMKLWYGNYQKIGGQWAELALDESVSNDNSWIDTPRAKAFTVPTVAPLPASIFADVYDTGMPGSWLGSFVGRNQDGLEISFDTTVDLHDQWRCVNVDKLDAATVARLDPKVNTDLTGTAAALSAAYPQFDDRDALWEKPEDFGVNVCPQSSANRTVWCDDRIRTYGEANGAIPGIRPTASWIYTDDQMTLPYTNPCNTHAPVTCRTNPCNPFTQACRTYLKYVPRLFCRWANLLGPEIPGEFTLLWDPGYTLVVHVKINKDWKDYFQIGRYPLTHWSLYGRLLEGSGDWALIREIPIPASPADGRTVDVSYVLTAADYAKYKWFSVAGTHVANPADPRDQTVFGLKTVPRRPSEAPAQLGCVEVPVEPSCWKDDSHSGWFSADARLYYTHTPDLQTDNEWSVDGIEFVYSWSKAYKLVNLTGVENTSDADYVPARFADDSDFCFNCPGYFGCDKDRQNREIYRTDPTDSCNATLYGRISLAYLEDYGFVFTNHGDYSEISGSLWAVSYSLLPPQEEGGFEVKQWHYIRFPIRIRWASVVQMAITEIQSWGYHNVTTAIVLYKESVDTAGPRYLTLSFVTTINQPYEISAVGVTSTPYFTVYSNAVRSVCTVLPNTNSCQQQWTLILKLSTTAPCKFGPTTNKIKLTAACRHNGSTYPYAPACQSNTPILNKDDYFTFTMANHDFCAYALNVTNPDARLALTMKPYHEKLADCTAASPVGCASSKQESKFVADTDATFQLDVTPDPILYPSSANYPFILSDVTFESIKFGIDGQEKTLYTLNGGIQNPAASNVLFALNDPALVGTRKFWSIVLVSSQLGLLNAAKPVPMKAIVKVNVQYALKSAPADLLSTTLTTTLDATSLVFAQNALWSADDNEAAVSVPETLSAAIIVSVTVGAAAFVGVVAIGVLIFRKRAAKLSTAAHPL